MARPEIEIDGKLVLKFASLGCKTTEIADYFGCSVDTIDRRFAEELKKGRANLRMSLRQWQLDAARNGNASLLIWLGKQMLDQKDQIDVSSDSPLSLTLNYERKKKPSND
jgi:hypothetical protein